MVKYAHADNPSSEIWKNTVAKVFEIGNFVEGLNPRYPPSTEKGGVPPTFGMFFIAKNIIYPYLLHDKYYRVDYRQ